MKKTIISIAAAALCASALSVTAFAEDVLTDRSICLDTRGSSMPSVKRWVVDGEAIVPDMNTIMPVYSASIYDYAKTGNFEIGSTPQLYIADSNDDYGNFTGIMHMKLNDGVLIPVYQEIANENTKSIAFEANAKRVSALMKKRSINTDCTEVKLVFMEHVGYAYYIDNGSEKMLVAANIGEVNSNIFNDTNGGIVVIGDELKAAADVELAEYNKYLEELQKEIERLGLGPDDPLPAMGGYSTPMFTVDNTPYLDGSETPSISGSNGNNGNTDSNDNPNTGSASSTLAGGIALTACVISISAAKKKKG